MQSRYRVLLGGLAVLAFVALAAALATRTAPAPAELAAATGAQDTVGGQIAPPADWFGAGIGPEQPIAYSHRVHAGQYRIECLYCHTNADRSQFVPIPTIATCMGCHRIVAGSTDFFRQEIAKIREYESRGESIPWVRVHKLADFVQFNHGRHVRAGLACQDCHSAVEEMDVIFQKASLTMGWCLDCHWKPADDAKRAEAEARHAEFAREGWESTGLYPKSIDSQYGVTRAPIDCAACHY